MKCPKCGSSSMEWEYLFPRENFEDKVYTCTECDHDWEVVKKDKDEDE